MPKQTNASCILVVEDHPSVRGFVASHLRDAGYVVLEATNGEEVIDMLRAAHHPPIGVVFTDIQLGGLVTGWDVADAFRKAHPEIPVIYTSGQSQNRQRQVPGSSFLPKPYLPSDIVELIEGWAMCRQRPAQSPVLSGRWFPEPRLGPSDGLVIVTLEAYDIVPSVATSADAEGLADGQAGYPNYRFRRSS